MSEEMLESEVNSEPYLYRARTDLARVWPFLRLAVPRGSGLTGQRFRPHAAVREMVR